jgi:hypothetical protein
MLSGDFAIGLMTIITGLAIADMVASIHLLLMNRERVRWDWLAMLAALFIFLLIVSSWGISYRNMGNQAIHPVLGLFVITLAQIIPMYLAARASLPDAVGQDGVSLASHYAEVSRYFWGSVAVTYVIFVVYGMYTLGLGVTLGDYLSPSLQLMMMVVLIAVPGRRSLHAALVPIIFALFCYDHLTGPMFG